jgi:two-component system, cell cycle sensor histidine kinase and response regulator CckA
VAKLRSFFTEISALPADLDGYVNGVCSILFEMYRPLRIAVLVTDKEGRAYEVGAPLPPVLLDARGAPAESLMSRYLRESGLPLYCNNLSDTEPYRSDPVVRELKVETYLGAPLRDSTGRIRGTLSLVDTQARALDSLDVEIVTVAALHLASRLRADEQEQVRSELEDHLRQAQKMEAVGMLAGGIAHDFNNILSGILGFSSLLLAKTPENSELHQSLALIEQSAVRAADLTRQLLAFARRKHFAKQPVVFNQVVGDVVGLLQRSLAKNIIIRPELADDLPPVLGDPGQLNQVLMNLCLNAADAMSERGGTLRIRSAHRLLNPRERATLVQAGQGEYVCVTVSDTGAGMSADVQKHLFDPFFTTKADRGGTGLGLSIVYGIVTNHGGDITVESAPDKGSVFKLYFPVHHGEAVRPEKAPALPLRGSETVMVVDDEMIVRQMTTAVLKEYGYKVLAVAGGLEAVETMKELKGRIHLVLLDMVMPGMDGEATFHAIREVDGRVPVLLSSGFADEGRSNRLLELGAVGMIHKPYKSEALLARIREILTSYIWSKT